MAAADRPEDLASRFVAYGDLPNAQPYPRRSVEDEEELEDDEREVDDEGIQEVLEEELPPPVARRIAKPGHRQLKPTVDLTPTGPSPWERPREDFTAAMTERVPVMRATKQAGFVKGI